MELEKYITNISEEIVFTTSLRLGKSEKLSNYILHEIDSIKKRKIAGKQIILNYQDVLSFNERAIIELKVITSNVTKSNGIKLIFLFKRNDETRSIKKQLDTVIRDLRKLGFVENNIIVRLRK